MIRILPVVLVGVGVGLHFAYCEWEVSEASDFEGVTAYERVIFAHHCPDFHSRRGLPRHMVLLARPAVDKGDAQLCGVLFPALLVVGAVLMWRFREKSDPRDVQYA